MGKKILVTGGAGFLGSHLCRHLLNKGEQVVCLDNLYTGKRKNIDDLMGDPRFEFIEHDIVGPIDIPVGQIYNLACPASPPHYQKDPVKTLKTSVIGILNMLDLAKKYGARILQASTSEVYGDPQVHPQTEDYYGHVNPVGIRSCYDEGKRAAETLMFDYHRQWGLEIKVARIFNTYGPGMDPQDGRVVSNFIMEALKGEDISIYGDGSQTRSFCYVSDLIEGLYRLMDSRQGFIGPCNIGNPGEITVKELAHKILRLTGSVSGITIHPLPQDDPLQRRPDIRLAEKELGWHPIVMLEEGLERTIRYFRTALG